MVTKINSGQTYELSKYVDFCELPLSPTCSCYPPSTNYSDEDDGDHEALIDRAHQLQDCDESDQDHEAQTLRQSADAGTSSR